MYVPEEVEGARGKHTHVARFKPLNEVTMVAELSKFTRWERPGKRGPQTIDPPGSIARTILQREDAWSFPRASGISTCPTIRQDGSIVAESGFDAQTRLLMIELPRLPAMPAEPTWKDVDEAFKLLETLLLGFPFVDEPSKSVALSILITPVVRGAMSVVPLHAVTAPTAGTRKSYLLDLATGILTGQCCPAISVGESEAQTEKRLASVMLTGQSIINIDNVNGTLGGDFLCQMISQNRKQVRILGKSQILDVNSLV